MAIIQFHARNFQFETNFSKCAKDYIGTKAKQLYQKAILNQFIKLITKLFNNVR